MIDDGKIGDEFADAVESAIELILQWPPARARQPDPSRHPDHLVHRSTSRVQPQPADRDERRCILPVARVPWAWPQPATCSSLNTSPTPYEPRPGQFEASFHAGSLAFSDEALSPLLARATAGPTVVIVYLDRLAVLPELDAAAAGLVVSFGASDGAVLDVVFGRVPWC